MAAHSTNKSSGRRAQRHAASARFADADVETMLQQARAGDNQAIGRLLKHYESFIYGSSMKVCGDREKGEQTAQDTLVSLFRKLHQFEGEAKLTTWIYSIVVNNCMMRRRQRKLDRDSIPIDLDAGGDALAIPAGESAAPDATLLNMELKEKIDEAIRKLPEIYRIVFFLRDVDNISTEEVAEALGLTVAAVKSRLHRARELLRAPLRRYIEEQAEE